MRSGFVVERSRTSDFALPDATFFRPANLHLVVDATGAAGAVYYFTRPRPSTPAATRSPPTGNQVARRWRAATCSTTTAHSTGNGAGQMPPTTPPSPSTSTRTVGGPSAAAVFGSKPATPAASTASMIDVAGLPATGLKRRAEPSS
jgi:hypothetical protein